LEEEKCAPRENSALPEKILKILAMSMRKRPPPYVGMNTFIRQSGRDRQIYTDIYREIHN